MSKTHRRVREEEFPVEYRRKSVQPDLVTAEWAVGRMAEHINYELERMIVTHEIDASDKADYAAMINRRIVKAVPCYDSDCRRGHCGRSASAVHYFTVVVANEINHIRQYLERACRNAVELPIAQLPPDEARKQGFISPASAEFSDGFKNVRQLDFRLDVNTLIGMLTPDEYTVLKMRLLGYTIDEIGDELGCCGSNVKKTYIKSIRKKARACGFVPSSEIRKGGV